MRYLYILLFSIALAADDHSSESKIDENCKDITKDNISERSFTCLLYTSPSPRDMSASRMPSSA